MPIYTVVRTTPAGDQTTETLDLADDGGVRDLKSSLSEQVCTIAVGRGADPAEAEWIGTWDWNNGAPCWTPAE